MMINHQGITLRFSEEVSGRALEMLRLHGAVILRDFVPDVSEADAEFEALMRAAHASGAPQLDLHHDKNLADGLAMTKSGDHLKIKNPGANLRADAPELAGIFARPIVRSLSEGYLGADASVAQHLVLTRDTGPIDSIVAFHFDEVRSLKFFLYLTEPGEDGGPFQFIRGTSEASRKVREMEWNRVDDYGKIVNRVIEQRSDGWLYTFYGATAPVLQLDTVSCVAPKGSLVVFDTDLLHRGGPLAEGRQRRVARAASYAGHFA
ncbi:phytanoyl-CoA dioxygenase family protein [uncultured Methylobacterium sp.]|jgi:hypothetical protein|uniref:phytanoyl-CoA dioxygenase family protein n=1 Tax=uncultured Methylobacterium sp. TaxID=157278 RepID=UPI002624A9C4|nr:phytanoyl-CoA dioxygenase family protein [uncultured Methylobacterium sp.]